MLTSPEYSLGSRVCCTKTYSFPHEDSLLQIGLGLLYASRKEFSMSRYNNKVYLLLLPLSPLNNARESQDFPSSKSLLFHPSRYLIGRLHIVEGSRLYFSKTKLKKNYHFFHLFSFHTIRNFIEHAGLQSILF